MIPRDVLIQSLKVTQWLEMQPVFIVASIHFFLEITAEMTLLRFSVGAARIRKAYVSGAVCSRCGGDRSEAKWDWDSEHWQGQSCVKRPSLGHSLSRRGFESPNVHTWCDAWEWFFFPLKFLPRPPFFFSNSSIFFYNSFIVNEWL